jgi:hypothetical protein
VGSEGLNEPCSGLRDLSSSELTERYGEGGEKPSLVTAKGEKAERGRAERGEAERGEAERGEAALLYWCSWEGLVTSILYSYWFVTDFITPEKRVVLAMEDLTPYF